MNSRSVFAIGSLLATIVGALSIMPAGAQTISGFSDFTLNQGGDASSHSVPSTDGTTLQLTTADGNEYTSAYYDTQEDVSNFTASFDYQDASEGNGNGFTFIVQTSGINAVGDQSFGSGQVGDDPIVPSVALETNLFTSFGQDEGTGVATDGDPGSGANEADFFTTPGSINLSSGDEINYALSYYDDELTETLTDETTLDTYTQSYSVDIPTALGASDAWVGFTGGTGGAVASQNVSDFTFTSGDAVAPAPESSTVIGLALMLVLGAGALLVQKTKATMA